MLSVGYFYTISLFKGKKMDIIKKRSPGEANSEK